MQNTLTETQKTIMNILVERIMKRLDTNAGTSMKSIHTCMYPNNENVQNDVYKLAEAGYVNICKGYNYSGLGHTSLDWDKTFITLNID